MSRFIRLLAVTLSAALLPLAAATQPAQADTIVPCVSVQRTMPTQPSSYDLSGIPDPGCFDVEGSYNDMYSVYEYMINGHPVQYWLPASGTQVPSYMYERAGTSVLTILARYYDPNAGAYVDGPSWTLTYNTYIAPLPPPTASITIKRKKGKVTVTFAQQPGQHHNYVLRVTVKGRVMPRPLMGPGDASRVVTFKIPKRKRGKVVALFRQIDGTWVVVTSRRWKK
ncbi:MAG TPA: hypothetical protein VGE34_04320 [Candidatus Saccharimonadales bacterium]